MKSVGMAYLEAIGRLISIGHSFRRTVHLSFMPDEEIGGNDGMKAFVDTDEFKALNVGFALDEGVPSPSKSYILFNDERAPWCILILATTSPLITLFLFRGQSDSYRRSWPWK